jgi:hypothetical protein
MGYRRVKVVERNEPAPASPEAPGNGVLDTGGLRLIYRENALREVHDQRSGTTYCARDGSPWPNLVFHVLDNQSWPSAGPELRREYFLPQQSRWLQTGLLRWHHRSQGVLGPFHAQIDTLVTSRDRELRISIRMEGHWEEAPLTGFVTLLGDIEAGGRITVDVPFGVEPRDPDHDIYAHNVPRNAPGITDMFERLRPGFFWGRSWADWSGSGHGVTWISADGNYYWFKEPGLLGHILLRCLRRTPDSWEMFTADHWSGSGVHTFTYAFRFHDGDWRAADPQHRSAELRHPPVVLRADCPTLATLPASHSFLELTGPAMLSAYYSEDHHLFIRLYEREGKGGETTLTVDWAPSTVEAVDLLGHPIDVPVRVVDHRVGVDLRPWQIVTLKMGRG